MADPKVNVIFNGVDKLSKTTQGIFSGLTSLTGISFLGVTAGLAGIGTAIIDVTKDAIELEPVQNTFDNLIESVGGDTTLAMEELRQATRGMVNDFDLMSAGNKFLAMGLADSSEEAANLSEIATQLGTAMGTDATTAMQDFALMLANQSIPRLDTFGLSSSVARQRIEELKEAGYDADEAFKMAVMEQAGDVMAKVGDQSETASGKMASLKATTDNLKTTLGEIFLPVATDVLTFFSDLAIDALPNVQTFVDDAQIKFGEFVDYLKTDFLTDVESFFSVDGDMANMNFFEWVSAFTQKLIPMMQPIIDEMTTWLQSEEVRDAVSASGEEVGTFIADGIKSLFASENGAPSIVQSLIDNLAQSSSNLVLEIHKIGIDFAMAVVQGILTGFGMDEEVASKITDTLGNVMDKVVEWLNPFETGKKIVNKVVEGINAFKYLIGDASQFTSTNLLTGETTTYGATAGVRSSGGRAMGGTIMPGRVYGVKEDEVISPLTTSQVTPSNKIGQSITNVFNVTVSSFVPPSNQRELERLVKPAFDNLYRQQLALRS